MEDHWLVQDHVAGHGDHDVAGPLQAAFEYRWAVLLQGPICLGMKFYTFRDSLRPLGAEVCLDCHWVHADLGIHLILIFTFDFESCTSENCSRTGIKKIVVKSSRL